VEPGCTRPTPAPHARADGAGGQSGCPTVSWRTPPLLL
jgi:hypothetical protein